MHREWRLVLKTDKSTDSPVRIIGSRDLHRNLPTILRELDRREVRYVLTVHGKPKAVLVGADSYLNLIKDNASSSEALVGLQLSALLGSTFEKVALEDLELPARRRSRLITTRPIFRSSAPHPLPKPGRTRRPEQPIGFLVGPTGTIWLS